MKLNEVYQIANALAPKRLSDEFCEKYGFYDNSGVLVDAGEEVEGILFSLDLSEAAVEEAVKKGVSLIITHHPAIYGKLSSIGEGLMGRRLVKCIKNGISVVSMHLNLDSAAGGIDESLAEGICLSAGETAGAGMRSSEKQIRLSEGGYGRAYEINERTLSELVEGLRSVFATNRVEAYGEQERKIKRVASFCGAGADEGAIAFALSQRADAILSSDFKHHVLSLALESGLSVITLTHYASEVYGFKKYYEKISRRVEIPCYFHEENILL